jgi:UDP-N-acetylmuramate: L-alanyl-gamma-D-glutamyl-meso-diaminopimelate ligase
LELSVALNQFPARVHHIHLMGICGTGMGALAGMLKGSGFHVTGSDRNVYPPMSDFLASQGIAVAAGYSPDNLISRPDLVIVGNVITRNNPEALELARRQIPYLSLPQALAHCYLEDRIPLVVTGTHGKTTTASLLASLLHKVGEEAGFMIGGLVRAFDRNYHIGRSRYFVVEGDEYDTAFFDKGPKFLHYRPQVAFITSIEFDHADIYPDLEAIKKSFRQLVRIMPSAGCLVAFLDDPVVREVVSDARCPVVGYGMQPENEWSLTNLEITGTATAFTAHHGGRFYGNFRLPMPGRHNALNSLAVIAVLARLGFEPGAIATALVDFEGVRRRQEVRGEVRGITVIDDFAHHPTAVRETLAALRAAYQGRRLVAVFEPRTNSSRRRVFQQTYVGSFDYAAQVLVKEPIPLQNIPEQERFSARRLVADLKNHNIPAEYFATTDRIIDYLAENSRPGDVIAILSNGGFDNIHERLLVRLRENNRSNDPTG